MMIFPTWADWEAFGGITAEDRARWGEKPLTQEEVAHRKGMVAKIAEFTMCQGRQMTTEQRHAALMGQERRAPKERVEITETRTRVREREDLDPDY